MDFNKLMQTMRDLDRPVGEAAVQECGDMMAGMPAPVAPQVPPHNPPTLTVNLNAQGMDDIESIMKLMTKVNPDMINQPAPLNAIPHAAEIEPMGMPSLTPPGPSISSIGDLGNLDSGPLKMLPDFDKDNDDMPGGEKDDSPVADIQKAMGDQDGDGDHDMDDHDMEKKDDGEADKAPNFGQDDEEGADDSEQDDDEEKEEAWANEPDTEVKSVDYMNNQIAGGMNRPKKTFPKVAGGDNPMQKMEGMDLRATIRAELQQRLAEAKGAK